MIKGAIKITPDKVVYFPYFRYYLSDSPCYYSQIERPEDMINQYQKLDLDAILDCLSASFRRLLKTRIIVNSFIVPLLIILLLYQSFL